VAAVDVGAVAGRIFLVQLNVAQQPGAGIAAFQQVVTENAVLGKAPGQGLFEGLDLVDALADERTLLEGILIDVGDGAGIGVDARLAAVQAGIAGLARPGQARTNPGLQDAVAGDDPSQVRVVNRPVEGVDHGADELARRVPGQLGVRVQGDDVFHAGQRRRPAYHQREAVTVAIVFAFAQQSVQVRQLAALALVAHPEAVVGVPSARAVEQEEDIAAAVRVLGVQGLDALPGQLQ